MTTISTQSIRFTGTLGKAVNPPVTITAEWTDDEEGR